MALYLLDLFGVAVFAISGALTAGRAGMDLFGAVVVAVITAVGGGTMRDVLLDNHPVFWIRDPTYLAVILAASTAAFLYARLRRPPGVALLVADAFGLAVFTFVGARTAYEAGAPGGGVMGAVTGAAGGVMRDVLCAEVPLILRRDIYATAALAGAALFVLLREMGAADPLVAVVCVGVVFGLRLATIRFGLNVPRFYPKGGDGS
jgi:uncharacterized membrane protein YeiH